MAETFFHYCCRHSEIQLKCKDSCRFNASAKRQNESYQVLIYCVEGKMNI